MYFHFRPLTSVLFSSDSSQTGAGFRLEWSCLQDAESASEGFITMTEYENNQDHEWTVSSDCDRVRIYSTTFHTEADYDIVTIDGVPYSGQEIVEPHN